MDRQHPQGIQRDQLTWVLTQPRLVRTAVRLDTCLLCCNHKVNEAGLCDICYCLLGDEEQRLAESWMAGATP